MPSPPVTARLTAGPVGSGLFYLTLPMFLGISANLIAMVAETWFLGQVGTLELAAYSFTFPVTAALTSLSFGVSIGLSSVLARTVGSGDQHQIPRLATDGVLLATLLMLVVGSVGYFSIRPLFISIGADQQALDLIQDYMEVWYFGLIFIAVPYVGSNALRATGDARISGFIMVGGSVLNIILDPILIFGWGAIPAMGLEGAAWALVIGRGMLFILTVYVLTYRVRLLEFKLPGFRAVLNSWGQIMTISIPATATQLIAPVSAGVIISLLADYGVETVAGFGVAIRIEALSVIPLFALSASIGPFVGQNWGAKLYRRADQAMKLSFIFSLGWGALVAAILLVLADPLVRLFDSDPQVIDMATSYLMMVPLSYGAWGVLMMASAIFNSLGQPIKSTIMSVTRMFILTIPLAILLEHFFGYKGIFAAVGATNLSMGLVGYFWNRRRFAAAPGESGITGT